MVVISYSMVYMPAVYEVVSDNVSESVFHCLPDIVEVYHAQGGG